MTKQYCLDRIAVFLAGRVADILVGGEPSTGASDDIEKATNLARKMVCEWGMSERLGLRTFGQKEEQVFLGRDISRRPDYSEQTAIAIDEEIRSIVEFGEERARKILEGEMETLHRLAKVLLEREVLDREEIAAILDGKELPPLTNHQEDLEPEEQAVGSQDGTVDAEGSGGPATEGEEGGDGSRPD
jgi:cell division protease FtsH